MKRTLIQNATIVNEGRSVRGSVVIEGEKIDARCSCRIDGTGGPRPEAARLP